MNRKKESGGNGRYLMLLDYDGTLTPIRSRPEQARLSKGTQRLLGRLAKQHQVILLSGRDIGSLRRLARPSPRVGLVGTHGAECARLPGLRMMPVALDRRLRHERERVLIALQKEFEGERGLQIEAKTLSLALHYRRARLSIKAERSVRLRFKKTVRRMVQANDWGFQLGKKMIDMKPRGFNKGTAVRALRKLYPDLRIFVAGDDLTDLDAFKAAGPNAIRVAVGPAIPRGMFEKRVRNASALSGYLGTFIK